MRWFDRSDKTQRIGTLETAIARLASEVMQIKSIAEKTQAGVEDIKSTMEDNHVEHTRCEGMQDGRWKEHQAEHRALQEDLDELAAAVKHLTEEVHFLNLARIRDQGQTGNS